MANQSVLGAPSHVAHLSREGFNKTAPFKFTSSTGQLLPVMDDVLNPGEKVRVQFGLFTRTQPLAKPAMVEIDEYIDLFFVPLHQLYSPFKQLFTDVNDFESSLFAPNMGADIGKVFPLFNPANWFNSDITKIATSANALSSQYEPFGSSFDEWHNGAMRLADHLGVPPDYFSYMGTSPDATAILHHELYQMAIQPMKFLAYQKCYFDYYRLSSWENNNIYAYNMDVVQDFDAMAGASTIYSSNLYNLSSVFTLRYRCLKRDYFKALEPSPLIRSFGMLSDVVGTDTLMGSDLKNWLYTGDTLGVDDFGSINDFGDVNSRSVGVELNSQPDGLSLAGLQQAYAVRKMLTITGRAGKHYDDQILAHFGFKVPQGISNEVYHLGTHHQKIHIGEVISTADTSGAPLGQLAGKGYGSDKSRVIKFVAPCHGILMAIYSAVPDVDYVQGFDKTNVYYTRYSFWQPELDKLGMQPLFGYEGYCGNDGSVPTNSVGWQWRYMERKTSFNRCTHAFDSEYNNAVNHPFIKNGPFADWTVSMRASFTGGQLYRFWCPPSALDCVMLQTYLRKPTLTQLRSDDWRQYLYGTDPLIHWLRVAYKKVSNMSTYGVEDF